ncbi:MAG: hypothetical protein BJ554DRAFT_5444, partial [Olpidium bornovanus]
VQTADLDWNKLTLSPLSHSSTQILNRSSISPSPTAMYDAGAKRETARLRPSPPVRTAPAASTGRAVPRAAPSATRATAPICAARPQRYKAGRRLQVVESKQTARAGAPARPDDCSRRRTAGAMAFLDGYSPKDKRNLTVYIAGIMLYKFALETLNGCVSSIVIRRTAPELGPNTLWTTMLAMNYACQCLGSVLVAPLAKRYKTNAVLAWAIFLFGLLILIVPVLEFVTGGGRDGGLGDETKPVQSASHAFVASPLSSAGTWNPLILFAIFPSSGIFYGMIEITRRVIPSDIVGVDEHKLKHMDSLVHICYEVAGTAGALLSATFISYFSYGYALSIIPVFYTAAAIVWYRIKLDKENDLVTVDDKLPFMQEVKSIIGAFFHSVSVGAKLVMTRRSLVWLVLAYSLPLVLHRYLENVLFAQYANVGL